MAYASHLSQYFSEFPTHNCMHDPLSTGSYPGVAGSEGANWSSQRKWMISTLNRLSNTVDTGSGVGGVNLVEDIVSSEAKSLCDLISDQASNGPVGVKRLFAPAINNVVMSLTTGSSLRSVRQIWFHYKETFGLHSRVFSV